MEKFYENDLVTLFNGDCVEVMKNLIDSGIKVDKVITSPPYNIIRNSDSGRCYDFYKDDKENNDYIKWIINIFELYDKILNENGCIIWNMSYGSENTELMNLCIAEILKRTNFTLADILIWKKQSAIPNNVSNNKMTRICEFVYIFCRRNEFYTFTTNKKQISTMQPTGQAVYENVFNFFETKNNDRVTELNKATFSSDFVDKLISIYIYYQQT